MFCIQSSVRTVLFLREFKVFVNTAVISSDVLEHYFKNKSRSRKISLLFFYLKCTKAG